MLNVAIIGRGNVGSHLYTALEVRGVNVTLVGARELDEKTVGRLNAQKCEIVVIAVKDDAVAEVARHLVTFKGIVVHTSGSMGMDILERSGINNYGVLYPLQTFSKDVKMDYRSIPIYIEASDRQTGDKIEELSSLISDIVEYADSDRRKYLHLGAVLACNFVNHLWALSEKYLSEHGLEFRHLLPLIRRTVEKIETSSPAAVQTGPAARHDTAVMEMQSEMLSADPDMRQIYDLLSRSIMKFNRKCQR